MMAPMLVLDVRQMPEVLARMRREMADILREQAAREASGYVRERLEAVAAAFESGQREGP